MTSASSIADKVPVTLLTGYLGAGKTTLLNNILSNPGGLRYAVIVNEYAELGIDADLIVKQDEEVIELSNGCLCCNVRHELAPTVLRLARAKAYDAILIETTGLATPQPIMSTFATDPDVAAVARLNSVVTVVDVRTMNLRLADSDEARKQIQFADHILLNKTDLVADEAATQGAATLRGLNPIAVIHRTERARVALATLMTDQAGDIDRLNIPANPGHGQPGHVHDEACGADDHDHHHSHSDLSDGPNGIGSVALTLGTPLDGEKISRWLEKVVVRQGPDILRAKGLLHVKGEARRIVVQIVAGVLEGDVRGPWLQSPAPVSRLVFIGRNLNPADLRSGFEACGA